MEEENFHKIVSFDFKLAVANGLGVGKKISMKTYVLGDEGEAKLKYIIHAILEKFDRVELMELIYTAAKELIVNSTKAAIKRMIFTEMGLDIHDETVYEKGMEKFKGNLNDRKFPFYRKKMKNNNYFVKIRFTYSKDSIFMEIINNFSLLPIEAKRIEEKLKAAKQFDNLFEFFMQHGDNTEGAGMGITMVEILLSQSGFERTYFKMHSSAKRNLTIASVIIPLTEEFRYSLVLHPEQLLVD